MNARTLIAALFLAALTTTPLVAQPMLRVAGARVDINPTENVTVRDGGGTCVLPDGLADTVFARILVLDYGSTRYLIVQWDLIFIPDVNSTLAAAAGVPEANVFASAVHSHNAPETSYYSATSQQVRRVCDSITAALTRLTPVRIGYTEGRNDFGRNRQPGWGQNVNANMTYDNRVTLMKFTRVSDGVPEATIVTYPAHQTGLYTEGKNSHPIDPTRIDTNPAHQPGIYTGNYTWRSHISHESASETMLDLETSYRSLNPAFTAVFLQGFAADCEPWPQDAYKTYAGMVQLAQRQASWCKGLLDQVTTYDATGLDGFLSSAGPLTIRGIVVGDIAILGSSGEVFVEIGSNLRSHSPFRKTLPCAYVGGRGYFGARDAFVMRDAGENSDYTIDKASSNPTDIEQTLVSKGVAQLQTLYTGPALVKHTPTAAAASSSAAGNGPAVIFDGNESRPGWCAAAKTYPCWVQLDLGATKNVSKVVMNFGGFYRTEIARNYRIEVSNDPSFASAATVVNDSNVLSPIIGYWFPAVQGRYVRFTCTAGNDSGIDPSRTGAANYTTVYEMEVYGPGRT